MFAAILRLICFRFAGAMVKADVGACKCHGLIIKFVGYVFQITDKLPLFLNEVIWIISLYSLYKTRKLIKHFLISVRVTFYLCISSGTQRELNMTDSHLSQGISHLYVTPAKYLTLTLSLTRWTWVWANSGR